MQRCGDRAPGGIGRSKALHRTSLRSIRVPVDWSVGPEG